MSKNSFMVMLANKKLFAMFMTGKILRYGFFIAFIFFLVRGTGNLAGYSLNQTIFFFLTFTIIDTVTQFLFREVYRFRPLVISGDLDLILVKPSNTLFRVLMGGADVIDLVLIPPIVVALIYVGGVLNPQAIQIIFYLLFLINSLLIATAFHIGVISLGIITLEIDHTIMIYRDLINLGRLPIDIYKQPLRGIITFLIPVGIMISFPAKAFLGLITPLGVIISFLLGGILLTVSFRFWNVAIKKYTSASS